MNKFLWNYWIQKIILFTLFLAPILNADEWPTYMFDNTRSGLCNNKLSLPLTLQWSYRNTYQPQPAWPAPAQNDYFHKKFNLKARVIYDRAFHLTAADGKLFFGSSADDAIHCLDMKEGVPLWSYTTEGPVRLAPSYNDGKVYAGSDDGAIYAINAEDGKLIWKCRPVKDDLRLPGNQRIISLFCIRSSIMIIGDKGIFTAGLFPMQGVYYGAVDLKNGKILDLKKVNFSAQGYLKEISDKIFIPTGRVEKGKFMKTLTRHGKMTIKDAMKVNKKYPYSAISNGEYIIRGGDDKIAIFSAQDGQKLWKSEVKGRAYSIIIANQKLFVSTDKGFIYCFGNKKISMPPKRSEKSIPLPDPSEELNKWADKILTKTCKKGYVLLIGSSADAAAARALANHSDLNIIIREPSIKKICEIRKSIQSAQLSNRIKVHHGDLIKTPYNSYIFDAVITAPYLKNKKEVYYSKNEVLRIIKPQGVFIDDNRSIYTPKLAKTGEWTHFYADTGNTTASKESNEGKHMQLQWFGKPGPQRMVDRHNRSVSPLVKNGLMFISGLDYFFGVDIYNGTVLWERLIKDSMRMSAFKCSGNMVINNKHLYVAAGQNCLFINPKTGKTEYKAKVPVKNSDWGYTAVSGKYLYGSSVASGTLRWRFTPTSWTIGYKPDQPIICSENLFSVDIEQKKLSGIYSPPNAVIITTTIAIDNKKVFFAESSAPNIKNVYKKEKGRIKIAGNGPTLTKNIALTALSEGSLKLAWKRDLKDIAFQHIIFMIAVDDKILLYGSKTEKKQVTYDIYCYAQKDGRELWHNEFTPREKAMSGWHGELTQHGVVVNNIFYIANLAFNIKDGSKIKTWDWKRGKHGCGTLSASLTHLFWRGTNPRVAKIADTFTGETFDTVNRPGCWIGIVPAGGLVLMPESSAGCTCSYPVQCSMAFRYVNKDKGE